ncbi:MAG: ATP-binding protein [Victivallales bacterium]|jgi:anti-sigma regulatory factor (Ser/Thr protein kinase)|nr:ATP-binding protein [Victivallales bacterium]
MLNRLLGKMAAGLKHIEHRAKPWFVGAALLSYGVALVHLAGEVDPVADLDEFLVKALAALVVPFGIILLQELFELLASISESTLKATRQQFEIVVLVLVRSFFKDFYKLNKAVSAGTFSEPVQKALVKVAAILVMAVLIMVFRRLSEKAGVERYDAGRRGANLWKQGVVILLVAGVLTKFGVDRTFNTMDFIILVFTGMIVVDAVFFLLTILRGHEFEGLMFDGGLVVALILARFPLFAANIPAYALSVVGVGFATACLYLFVRSAESDFLGVHREDDVERCDLTITNQPSELETVGAGIASFAEQCQIPKAIAQKVRLACDELLSNVMNYAYEDQGEHEIQVMLALAGGHLIVTVSDDGTPFNPLQHRPADTESGLEERQVGGLGIHLVRSVMDRVSYRRQTGRNVVTALKYLNENDAPRQA